jgi:Protein of unknown function (DUF3224)
MSTRATATFKVTKWDEHPYQELDGGRKFTKASVTRSYTGDFEGDTTSESLMYYREDGTASYTGFEYFAGRLNGRSGSFAILGTGTFEKGVAKTSAEIVPGSGTGELRGIRGTVQFESGHADRYPITVDYDL